MRPERWTAQNVKLDAEAKFAAERQAMAQKQVMKFRNIMIAEGVGGMVVTVAAGLVSFEAGAVALAVAVVGFIVCLYFWIAAKSRVDLARTAIGTLKSEQKQLNKQKPRDMV